MKFSENYQPLQERRVITKKSGVDEAVKVFAESENFFFVKIDTQTLSVRDKTTDKNIGFIDLQTLIVCQGGRKEPRGIKEPKLSFEFSDNLISVKKIKELLDFVESFDFSDKKIHF